MLYVIGIIVVLIILYIAIELNKLIKSKNRVNESFSTMDIYLKKRWDLIPNLVEVVKGYASHEKSTLEEVIKYRNVSYDQMGSNEKIEVNNNISNKLNKIMALVESYPELKADDNFKKLGGELVNIEDEIAKSRKYYNGCVRIYNNYVEMFPSNIVALIFNFKSKEMFIIDNDERNNIKIEL